MNITNFETTVYNPILKTETKGFVNKSLLETYMTNKTKKKDSCWLRISTRLNRRRIAWR